MKMKFIVVTISNPFLDMYIFIYIYVYVYLLYINFINIWLYFSKRPCLCNFDFSLFVHLTPFAYKWLFSLLFATYIIFGFVYCIDGLSYA